VWTYEDAEAYLADTAPPGKSVYGLGRINHLLDLLDHPENHFPCVTIVGTNGKGSVLAFMDSLLRAHGVKVACHIKPHLESVTERIRIDGRDSRKDEFAAALWKVRQAVDKGWSRDDRPTYFELIFAAFLSAAETAGVDISLLETGLGGRLDAVNSVDAPVVVMTSVDLDHTDLLGDSLESIALEKLAVVREGSTLVCQVNPPEVMNTVRSSAESRGFRLVEMTEDRLLIMQNGSYQYHSPILDEIGDLSLSLKGPFQRLNASLSLLAFEILSTEVMPDLLKKEISADAVRHGMSSARLPGRWEVIDDPESGIRWILDGAHNPAALKEILDRFGIESGKSGTVIFGMKKGKDAAAVMAGLVRSARRVIFVEIPGLECFATGELAGYASEELDKSTGFSQIQIDEADSISGAIRNLRDSPDPVEQVLVTGSLYLVGAVRSILRDNGLIPDEGIRVSQK